MDLINLFPIPVGLSKLDRPLSESEKRCFKKISKIVRTNLANTTSTDNYVLSNPDLKDIKEFIELKITDYVNKTNPPKSKLGIYITQSWINYTGKNQSHHRHWHHNSFISGVFYINAKKEHDKIYFIKDNRYPLKYTPSTSTLYNSDEWYIPVESNLLVLFPSSLNHYVGVNNQDYVRESLSFNTFLKGKFGETNALTELIL